MSLVRLCVFFFQAEDGIRDVAVTGVQTCALPIFFNRVLRQGHHSSRVCLDNRNRTAPAFLRPTPSRLGSCYSRFTRASFPRAAASRVALLRARQRRRSVEPRAREYSEFKLLRDSFHHY